jgi:hypothetical protein
MNKTYDLYYQLKPLVEYNRFLNAGKLVKNVIENNIPGRNRAIKNKFLEKHLLNES